jgi:hypothetical protein
VDPTAVNNYANYVNLQIYGTTYSSGSYHNSCDCVATYPSEFTSAGINKSLLGYGALFEGSGSEFSDGCETSLTAYSNYGNLGGFSSGNFYIWRIDSGNYGREICW